MSAVSKSQLVGDDVRALRAFVEKGEDIAFDEQDKQFVLRSQIPNAQIPKAQEPKANGQRFAEDHFYMAELFQRRIDANSNSTTELVPLLTAYFNRITISAPTNGVVVSVVAQAASSSSTSDLSVERQLEHVFNKKLEWETVAPRLKNMLKPELILKWLDLCAEKPFYPHLLTNCIKYLREKEPHILKKEHFVLFKLCQGTLSWPNLGDIELQVFSVAEPVSINSELLALKCPSLSRKEKRDLLAKKPFSYDVLKYIFTGRIKLTEENYLVVAELADSLGCQELLDEVDLWFQERVKRGALLPANYMLWWRIAMTLRLRGFAGRLSEWLLAEAHKDSPGLWYLQTFLCPHKKFLYNHSFEVYAADLNLVPIEAVANYPNIRKVTLRPNTTVEEFSRIVQMLPQLEEIDASGNKNIGANEIQALAASRASKITALNLKGCPNIGKEAISALQRLTGLRRLRLGNNRAISPEALQGFKDLKELQEIEISHTPEFSRSLMRMLSTIPYVKVLVLENNPDLEDGALQEFSHHPTVQEVRISECALIRIFSLLALCQIPKLSRVSLRKLPDLVTGAVKALIMKPYMRYIDLTGSRGFAWGEILLTHTARPKVQIVYDQREIDTLGWSDELPQSLDAFFTSRGKKSKNNQTLREFKVGDSSYRAYGPLAHEQTGKMTSSFYRDVIEAVQPQLIVNLMCREQGAQKPEIERCNTLILSSLPMRFKKESYPNEDEVALFKAQGSSQASSCRLYHVKKWIDMKAPNEATLSALLDLSATIIRERQTSPTARLFVHCQMGHKRTASFIAIIELLQLAKREQTLTFDQMRAKLFLIITQIQESDRHRFPHMPMLKLLFSDPFLARIKKC